ncbi:MAG: c-type cytochrome, partial [Planctomycetota bacterium]
MRAITVLFYSCFPLAILASSAAAQTLTEQLVAEGVTRVASAAREKGDAVRGAIIFSQQKMNCVKCHQTGAQDLLGPDLTQLSRETTDVYIVESLLMPSKVIKEGYGAVKILTEDGIAMTGRVLRQDDQTIVLRDNSESGRQITLAKETLERLEPSELSAMPADLANQLSNRQQFLDLSKYLMDLAASSDPSGRSIELRDIDTAIPDRLHGIALMDRLRCVGCHDGELQQPVPFAAAPDLSNASARIDPEYLEQYIQDPHRLKPGTSMPNVMGHLDESTRRENVEAIVAYLQSRSEGTFHRDAVDDAAAKRGEQTFHEVGCVACHSPRDASGKETLDTDSAALGDVASKYSLASLTQFLEDPHAIRPSGRMPNLKLTHWEAVDLASYLISNPSRELKQNSATEHDSTSTLDPKLVKRGAQSYVALGCAFCHESEIGRPVDRPFASLSDLPQQLNS